MRQPTRPAHAMNSRPPLPLANLVAEAESLTRAGRPQEAHGLWERILAIDPAHATALNQLGALTLAHGDLDGVGQIAERLASGERLTGRRGRGRRSGGNGGR